MSNWTPVRTIPATIALPLTFAVALATFAGCSANDDAVSSGAVHANQGNDRELIGGDPAGENYFRSTVALGDSCTAAKVGAHLFLTAAHCVALGRPPHGMSPPENFPPNDGIRDDYLPGQRLLINWGIDANSAEKAQFTIVKTSIHPSWWTCPLCSEPILGTDGAADIAVIQISEDTPTIPEASVELSAPAMGTRVVKVGWGCEERTNVEPCTVHLNRFKAAAAQTISATEIQRYDSRITDEQAAMVDASYLITPGHDQDAQNASLCLGDSGGPLYLADSAAPRVVGVNSDYTFKPISDPNDLGGVSWTDWHTRTSLDSLHHVGQWLIDLGVNTAGGS